MSNLESKHNEELIKIISKSNSIKVSFNVPKKSNYSDVYEVLIHESNASVLKELHDAGFSMYMTKKGLWVTKIG